MNVLKVKRITVSKCTKRLIYDIIQHKYTSESQLLGPIRKADNSSTLTERPEKLRLIHLCNVFGLFINH